jgi:hypothetical protein
VIKYKGIGEDFFLPQYFFKEIKGELKWQIS